MGFGYYRRSSRLASLVVLSDMSTSSMLDVKIKRKKIRKEREMDPVAIMRSPTEWLEDERIWLLVILGGQRAEIDVTSWTAPGVYKSQRRVPSLIDLLLSLSLSFSLANVGSRLPTYSVVIQKERRSHRNITTLMSTRLDNRPTHTHTTTNNHHTKGEETQTSRSAGPGWKLFNTHAWLGVVVDVVVTPN